MLKVPWLAEAELKVTVCARLSVRTTLMASDGPLFVTVSVYVSAPVRFGSGAAVFSRAKSAEGIAVISRLDVLLPVSGSKALVVICAVFVLEPALLTLTANRIVKVELCGRVPKFQVITRSEIVPVKLLKPINSMPPGSVSITWTFGAKDGPALAISMLN